MDALRYKPSAFWLLDGSSPFTDYSGYGSSAVRTGTQTKGLGLISDATYSEILDSAKTIAFASKAYNAGNESQAFTLMATIFPIKRTTTANQQILSNLGKMDGLTINGTVVTFSTAYVGQGSAACSFDLGFYEKANIFAVHTRTKNSLYVNNKLVDEVDITSVQQTAVYDAPDTNLYSGTTTSTQAFMLNGVGIFGRALTTEEISSVNADLNRRFAGSVPHSLDGKDLFVSKQVRTPYLDFDINSEDLWNTGIGRSVSVEGTALYANTISSLTVAGQWNKSFEMYNAGNPDTLNSLNVQWTGKNVTVEASVNAGTTWTTLSSGVNLSTISPGFSPLNKTLDIRITFTGNVDEAYIDNFQINGYLTNTAIPLVGRTITYTNAVNYDERTPMDLREDWGVKLSAGTLAFGADNSEVPHDARTIEVWMKENSTTDATLSFSPTTTYVNGIAAGSAGRGEWALYHYVLPSVATTFTISGDVTIGKVAIYDFALTAGQVFTQYTNYTGLVKTTYDGTGLIAIAESSPPATVYAHDWAISAA